MGSNGQPLKWDNRVDVVYNCDPGDLSASFPNARAVDLVDRAFRTWTELSSVKLTTSRGTPLSADVTVANVNTFIGTSDGLTPVIFDRTGEIVDGLFGEGARNLFLGAAAPEFVQQGGNIITEGVAVMNGVLLERESENGVLTVFVHEFGHMLGLGHAQLNGGFLTDGIADNQQFIPIMYPILRNTEDDPQLPSTLTLDDEASMAFIYPVADFASRGGNLTGRVLMAGSEFRGANVIARQNGSNANAVSWPSGIAQSSGGAFEMHLLPPGDYSVFVEPIDPAFTGGSRLGDFDPPPSNVHAEFFNGANESGDPLTDDPNETTLVAVGTGQQAGPVEVHLSNGTLVLNPGAESSGKVERSGTIRQTSGALPEFQFEVPVAASTSRLSLTLVSTNGAQLDLYTRAKNAVALNAGVITADAAVTGAAQQKELVLTSRSVPAIQQGSYFLAVVNNSAVAGTFKLTAAVAGGGGATGTTAARGGGGSGCSRSDGDEAGGPLGALLLLAPLACAMALKAHSRGAAGEAR